MRPARLAWLGATLVLGAWACVERIAAPGECPAFCPSGSIQMVDTMLRMNLARDSAYRGYVFAHEVGAMVVADVPGVVDSRGILVTGPLGPRLVLAGDTNSDPIVGSDSLKLTFTITRRDPSARDLTLRFYRLPPTLDSATTFAGVDAAFGASPLRSVNLDSLLAKVKSIDSTTGDSVGVDSTTGDAIRVDTVRARRLIAVTVKFDSVQAPYVAADSGRLGIGVRIGAATPPRIAIGTIEGLPPTLTWFVKVDSITASDTTLIDKSVPRSVTFDSYVFDPPAAALDSTLAVGGVPSARSLLRVSLPRAIRDSSQVIRGTLILVPAVAARGVAGDSFVVEAYTLRADFGAKSPLFLDQRLRPDTALIRIEATDTVRIEVTNLVQIWASDTLVPTAIVLRSREEGANLAEIRFYPSAAAAYRPALRVTYARRFPFGVQ
jgi:hypothetical protein